MPDGSCRLLLPFAFVNMGWFESYYVSVQILLNVLYVCTDLHACCLKVNTCHVCLPEKDVYACDLCVSRECECELVRSA